MNRKVLVVLIAIVVAAGLSAGAYALTRNEAGSNSIKPATNDSKDVAEDSKTAQETKAATGGGSSTINKDDGAGEPVDPSDYIDNTTGISISNYAFDPATITVKKSTTVTWGNQDAATHTVTSADHNGPKSDQLVQNQLFSYKFTKAGTYHYFSDDAMKPKGTIIVTE